MTVNTTTITSGPYAGNGIADQFSYTFKIEDKTQVAVYETDGSANQVLLTVDTDYTVAGIGNDSGGVITRVSGALPADYEWYIRSDYKLTQLTAFSSQGAFFPDVHEDAMDKLTFLIQQGLELNDRAIRLSESETPTLDMTLPSTGVRGGRLLGFSPTGELDFLSVAIASGDYTYVTTVSAMKALTGLQAGVTVVQCGERSDALFEVIAGVGTANTLNRIADNSASFTFVLRTSTVINLFQAGALPDDTTDIKAVVEAVEPLLTDGGTLFLPAGQYYMSGDGATLTNNDITILGESGTEIRAERTYFVQDSPSVGKHIVGQGNIFNGTGLTGTMTFKNITFVGAYDESWGDQDMANGSVPYGLTSKLLFLLNCEKVVLDTVKIKNAFSSNSTLGGGGWADDVVEKFGYNAILISGCDDVQLIYCDFVKSCGEAWHVYNCGNCDAFGNVFENDYGVSYLDVTFCEGFHIAQNRFRKLLAADSGELLNVASSNGNVSGNTLLNGNIDIGNEYINRGASLPLAKTFVLHDQVVSNNTLYNGHIAMSTQGNATSIVDWVQENVVISDNIITIDLDTRPSADGFTILNYSGVVLPEYHDARNISVLDNTILLKGALQNTGANPHLYNNIKLINCDISGVGVTRKGISITGNMLEVDLSNYDPDEINDLSGAILLNGGTWIDTVIENNFINSEMGIYLGETDAIERMAIKSNELKSEFFLNAPWTSPTAFDIDGIDVTGNKFTFLNTAGHTYTTAEAEEKGFGYFINMRIGSASSVEDFTVKDNKVECAAFVLASNFQSTTSSLVDVIIDDNVVNFVDYVAGSPTYYPMQLGRTTGSQTPNGTSRIVNNYFTEASASTVLFNIRESMAFELITNVFVGTFDIDVQADATVAGVPESRMIIMNNVATVAFDIAVLTLDTTAVTTNVANNVNITQS